MKITLIRHAKVCYQWKRSYTSKEFNIACEEYDNSPIDTSVRKDIPVSTETIYISSLSRTYDTASLLFPGKTYQKEESFDEVPLSAFINTETRLPFFVWNVLGRIQWMLNLTSQKEIKRETVERIQNAIKQLEEKNEDCIIVTHGYFMRAFQKELRKKHYQKHRTSKFENLAILEFEI